MFRSNCGTVTLVLHFFKARLFLFVYLLLFFALFCFVAAAVAVAAVAAAAFFFFLPKVDSFFLELHLFSNL